MSCAVSAAGGLAAVIYTDTLQMFVMVIGALVLTVISQYIHLPLSSLLSLRRSIHLVLFSEKATVCYFLDGYCLQRADKWHGNPSQSPVFPAGVGMNSSNSAVIMGYQHQRADERHGNPPQGNQELLVVRDKVE